MELESDSHFHEIPVNTTYSAVHVPTNIFDLAPEVNVAIQWSKDLDEVFRQNYQSDPALSWQYFGSSTGFLRLFPAMQWKSEDSEGDPIPDMYDCRRTSWYIESATCSKDMVILLDMSGSMYGDCYSIGRRTQWTSDNYTGILINCIVFLRKGNSWRNIGHIVKQRLCNCYRFFERNQKSGFMF